MVVNRSIKASSFWNSSMATRVNNVRLPIDSSVATSASDRPPSSQFDRQTLYVHATGDDWQRAMQPGDHVLDLKASRDGASAVWFKLKKTKTVNAKLCRKSAAKRASSKTEKWNWKFSWSCIAHGTFHVAVEETNFQWSLPGVEWLTTDDRPIII